MPAWIRVDDPTPEQIAELTAEIRKTWTETELRRRHTFVVGDFSLRELDEDRSLRLTPTVKTRDLFPNQR